MAMEQHIRFGDLRGYFLASPSAPRRMHPDSLQRLTKHFRASGEVAPKFQFF
jgi:hypothetical protein